jgi:ABC-2 type transport system permease protein
MTLLTSAPISMTDIVLGKFFGLMIFFCSVILLVMVLSLSLLMGGTLDAGLLLSNAAGLLLICACFAALGLYISSLTDQPAVAAAGTLGALLGLWVMDIAVDDGGSIMRTLSLLKHYESFNRGLIDTFDLAYFSLFILTFLVLAIRRLDGERLRG